MAYLKAGDVVELKSGGPQMTVESTGKDAGDHDLAYCAWFHGLDKKTSAFPPDALKLVTAAQ